MYKQSIFAVILVLISKFENISSVNILVLESLPSHSHHIWIKTLSNELASKGYNVTSLSADVDLNSNVHYIKLDGVYEATHNESSDMNIDILEMGQASPWSLVSDFQDIFVGICKVTVKSSGYRTLLDYPDDFKFDLVLYEFISHPCLLPFMHKFNYPPLIALTAFNGIALSSQLVGSRLYSTIPYYYHKEIKDSFVWRVNNYLLYLVDYYYINNAMEKAQEIVNPLFPELPNLSYILKMTKLVFVNTHPTFEISEPTLPNVINCGGMQISKPKPLPKELQTLLDASTNGVIYFALGSNMRSDKLGADRLTHILEAFRKLPEYTILWKFESNTLPVDVPKNVHIKAWMPQNDILAHPNVKLFITHCGLLSSQESIWHGVSMLGVPLFVDQFMNLQKSEKLGIAHGYIFKELNQDTFSLAIKKAVESKELSKNIKLLSKVFRDQPESSLDRAVWWTEWLLRNPEASDLLKSSSVNQSFFVRESIDVSLFLAFVIFIILLAIFNFFKCIFKRQFVTLKLKTN